MFNLIRRFTSCSRCLIGYFNQSFYVACLLIITLPILPLPAYAGIYKWTDKQGHVHFSDQPANVESATEMNVDTGKAGITNSSGNTEARETLLKSIELDKKDAAERQKKLVAVNNNRRKLCEYYRNRSQRQQRLNYTYRETADGEREYLTVKQHDALKKNLKANMNKYCGR